MALAIPGGCPIGLMQPRAVGARDPQPFPVATSRDALRQVLDSKHTNHLVDSTES